MYGPLAVSFEKLSIYTCNFKRGAWTWNLVHKICYWIRSKCKRCRFRKLIWWISRHYTINNFQLNLSNLRSIKTWLSTYVKLLNLSNLINEVQTLKNPRNGYLAIFVGVVHILPPRNLYSILKSALLLTSSRVSEQLTHTTNQTNAAPHLYRRWTWSWKPTSTLAISQRGRVSIKYDHLTSPKCTLHPCKT